MGLINSAGVTVARERAEESYTTHRTCFMPTWENLTPEGQSFFVRFVQNVRFKDQQDLES